MRPPTNKSASALDVTDSPESVAGGSHQGCVVPLATPEIVPREIATCPECGGTLYWQATTRDILVDMMLECESERDEDDEDETDRHRWWQSDWQPIIQKVKTWIETKRHNAKLCDGRE